MALNYTTHARQRLGSRNISEQECEDAVKNDRNPWQTKLKAGDHFRFFSNNVTVITDKAKSTVVTAFKGDPGNWGPEKDDL